VPRPGRSLESPAAPRAAFFLSGSRIPLVLGYHVDLDHRLELHRRGLGDEALPQVRGYRLHVVRIQIQFFDDLKIGEVEPREMQAQYPNPERLMMARQDRAGQVIEATVAALQR
jgi:hypothetical protein